MPEILMKKLVPILFLILFSCSSNKVHDDFKFNKKKLGIVRPTELRIDGVYYMEILGLNYKGEKIDGYKIIKFKENGECFLVNWQQGKPNWESLSIASLKGENAVFLNVGNEIQIEHWGGNYSGYCLIDATVNADKLIFHSFKPRGLWTSKQPIEDTYYFKPAIF
jgi:hypothetical protein